MIFLRQISRVVKYVTVGGVAVGTLTVLHKNDYDISSIGLMRLGRAGFAAVRIFVDYKLTFRKMEEAETNVAELMSQVHQRSADRLLKLARANGGVWIKQTARQLLEFYITKTNRLQIFANNQVGQHIGALEYLLPEEYVRTMRVLHSKAPQSSLADLEKVFQEDFGGTTIWEVFDEFEKEPIGAASLAQVHKAKTKDGGHAVAIKIQHPRVKPHSFVDIATMEALVNIAAWLFPEFKLLWLAEETKRNLPLELDFIHEGHNCERVQRMLQNLRFLKVPKIYWDYSSSRVLTMEFCDGGQVNDADYFREHDISAHEVSRQLGQMYSEMIFIHGYVHCDPHPGNVLVHKEPHSGRVNIVLLDHGLYTSLTDDFRMSYANLWLSLFSTDVEGIKKWAQTLGVAELYALFVCMLTARSWKSVQRGIDKSALSTDESTEIKGFIAAYLPQISDVLSRIPSPMLLILKTNDLLRGIEWTLGTQNSALSFLYMSKCCTNAVLSYDYNYAKTRWRRFRISLRFYWIMGQLTVYETWLSFKGTLVSLWRMLTLGKQVTSTGVPS